MSKSERRVVIALIGVAIWLGGLYYAIVGLIYERAPSFRYGTLAIFIGVAVTVIASNLISIPGISEKKKETR